MFENCGILFSDHLFIPPISLRWFIAMFQNCSNLIMISKVNDNVLFPL